MTKRKKWIFIIVLALLVLGALIWLFRPKKFVPERVEVALPENISQFTAAVDNVHVYRYTSPEKLAAIRAQWNGMELETLDWRERDELTTRAGVFACEVTVKHDGQTETYQLMDPCIQLPDGTWCREAGHDYDTTIQRFLEQFPADDPEGACVENWCGF